jgi:uncharacterized protein (TIGR00299 family) protein
MNVLYCDCFSGISGDMFLAALLDAGLPQQYLSQQLAQLKLPGFQGISVSKVNKESIQATLLSFEIATDQGQDQLRHLADIITIIENSSLPIAVQQTSKAIFQKLAEAEAKVHGSLIEDVHFHEVGAVDSILDIVGASIGIHYFSINQVYASALPLGCGQVQTQHGLLPLPAPATMEMITAAQAPVVPSPATSELVTPTGAAILSTLAKFEQPSMKLHSVGIGAGRRDLPWPNILRVFIGDSLISEGSHVELETNIDDMNPQFYGHIMSRLFEAGALDVYFTPIIMKKNRPATKFSVIARREDESKISDLLLRETSTLGVRVNLVHRHEAEREIRKITTRFGEVTIKLKIMDGKVIQISPEYEDCARLASENHLPLAHIYNEVLVAANELIKANPY